VPSFVGEYISGESMINIVDSTVDICASRFYFYSYSVDEIGLLDSVTLHRLLLSPSQSLSIKSDSDNALLRWTIELDHAKSGVTSKSDF
jgi:hypothetical protein